MEREDVFQWLARELAQERAELEARHGLLLKELSTRFAAPKGPLATVELMRLAPMIEMKEPEKNGPQSPESLPGPGPEAIDAKLVISAEEEMEDSESEERDKAKQEKYAKKEQSELSNTLRKEKGHESKRNVLRPLFITNTATFELVFAVCIMLHAVLMAGELQYRAMDVGKGIGFDHYTQSANEAFPAMEHLFYILEWVFGILFMCEAILKMMALRCGYFKELWNCFDLSLCLLWIADRALEVLPFDTSMVRLLRLARLLRLVKLARQVQGFDALAVMTTSLHGSVNALLWVAVLLVLVQMTFALLLSQVLLFFVEDDSQPLQDRKDVFEYFGNFTRAMLTMFEITLGNWPPVARLLQEKVNSWFVIFSIGHKIIFGFACLAVINGVFMQETFKVAQQDDQIMLRTVEIKRQAHRRKMQMFFQHANDDDDNILSMDEWKEVISEEKVKHWFAAQGLSISDPELLWQILDTSGDRQLDLEELIQGTARLQGAARSLDLAVLNLEHRNLQAQTKEIQDTVDVIKQQMSMLIRTSMGMEHCFA